MAKNDHARDTDNQKRVAGNLEHEAKLGATIPNMAPGTSSDPLASTLPVGVDADALADMQTYSNLQERRKKAKRKKTITIVVVCAIAAVLLVVGATLLVGAMTTDPADSAPTQTAFVEEGLFLDEVSASGNLKPVSSVIATPEVEGLVGEVLVSEGDVVAEGQVLYTVVNSELDRAISEAQRGVSEANNGVAQAQISVDDAYRAKRQGLETAAADPTLPFDVGQADSAIKQAELALGSAWNTLTSAQTSYNEAVARAEKRTVTSPISGNVVAVNIEPGQSISSSGSVTAIPVQIADLSQMLVSVEVNEVDILKIKVDQIAKLTFSSLLDLELEGTVIRIATVNTGTGGETGMGSGGTITYKVDILVQNPDPRLKPGMTVRASVESNRIEGALMVPLSAVSVLSATEGSVSVVNPDDRESIQERTVEIVASNGLTMVVKGDISKGEEILLVSGETIGTGSTSASSGAVTEVSVG